MNGRRIAATVLAGIAGAVLLASPVQAATATQGPGLTLRGGTHHHGALHAGSYLLGGHVMYCESYGLGVGDGNLHQGIQTSTVTYITYKWGDTTDPTQAADVYFAINSTLGNRQFDADLPGYENQLPDHGARVKAMVAEAKRYGGPWQVHVTVPAVSPGVTTMAHVTVSAASGVGVPGVPVTLRAVGADVAEAASTGSRGVVLVPVHPTTRTYTISATVWQPDRVWVNTPTTGRQVLVGRGATKPVTGTACATTCPVSADLTIHAACTDRGVHKVTVTWTTDATPGMYTGTLAVGDQIITPVSLAPGASQTINVTAAIGDTIIVGYTIDDHAGAVLVASTLTSATVTA